MREIVLDTETTGLDPLTGHRIVEIGCIELQNHLATGTAFHRYVNPERDMPAGAFEIHGLSAEFLAQHPPFAALADELMAFIGDAPLIIHNAEFDMRFLNAELTRLGREGLKMDRAIDTVRLARTKFPGAQVNLDALCRRFGIDNSARTKHGALLDAELLAEVYLELIGGRQPDLSLGAASSERAAGTAASSMARRASRPPRPHIPSAEEEALHRAFVEGQIKDALWLKP